MPRQLLPALALQLINSGRVNMDKGLQIEICMKDAGMEVLLIKKCMEYLKLGEIGCARKRLFEHRTKLLAEIQNKQKQLNCLDYLMESDYLK